MRCDRTSSSWSAVQVRTYDVVPVSSSLGLVEFVPATQPLKQAIMAYLDPEVRRLGVSIVLPMQERILAYVGKTLTNLYGMPGPRGAQARGIYSAFYARKDTCLRRKDTCNFNLEL